MRGRRLWLFMGGTVTLLALLVVWQSVSVAGDKHALLIGIQDYGSEQVPSLKGPRQDIDLVAAVLEDPLGVANIERLVDAEATHSGIRDAFSALAARVKPGDSVYIHFSGHGAQTRDLNGDEESDDGLDETWVTYGARSGRQTGIDDFGILDDQINAWLKPVLAKTDDVVVVMDSCHSASATRGNVTGVRSVSADEREHPLGREAFDRADQPSASDALRLSGPSAEKLGVRIGAARDRETAIEIEAEDGKHYGLFTWYWARALEQAQSNETWSDLFKRVSARVKTHPGAHQRPQLEGSARRGIFGGNFTDRASTIAVLEVDTEKGLATIDTGAANGATVGSVYRGFDPQEPDREDLPTLELQRVSTFDSEGKITRGKLEPDDLVVEERHAYHFEPIRLAVEGDFPRGKDRELLARLEASLEHLSGFNVVKDRADADWIVYVLRPRRVSGQPLYASPEDSLPRSFTDEAPEAWVVSAKNNEALLHERMRIPLDNPENGIKVLRDNLDKYARIQELKRLGSGSDALDVELLFFLLRAEPGCDDGCVELMAPDGARQLYGKQGPLTLSAVKEKEPGLGDVLGFAIQNRDKRRSFYAYLINIAPGGDVQPIFPRPHDNMEYARIDAGELRDLTSDVGLMFNEAGENAPVEEYIKLIVTSQPIDVRVFQREGYRTRSASAVANPLERLIGEALHTRGQLVVYPDRDWAAREAVFEIPPAH